MQTSLWSHILLPKPVQNLPIFNKKKIVKTKGSPCSLSVDFTYIYSQGKTINYSLPYKFYSIHEVQEKRIWLYF